MVYPLRLDAVRATIPHDHQAANDFLTVFATSAVPIDQKGLRQAQDLAQLPAMLQALHAAGWDRCWVEPVVFTPDMSAGPGVPVGTVLAANGVFFPKLLGRDLHCGVHLIATSLTVADIDRMGSHLDTALRHAFFQGGRDMAWSEHERRHALLHGLNGLPTRQDGLWPRIRHLGNALAHHGGGMYPTDGAGLAGFEDFLQGSGDHGRDGQIGAVGGGNHFVELSQIDQVLDRHAAYAFGLHVGQVVVLVHTGSLGLGAMVGERLMDMAKALWPKGLAYPATGLFPLPLEGAGAGIGQQALLRLGVAGHIGQLNRLACAALCWQVLDALHPRAVTAHSVWGAAHNYAFTNGTQVVHRKGATPAEPGVPVLLPGSMGDASYVLQGLGGVVNSAPHGAGRAQKRGAARNASLTAPLRVVGPIDPRVARADIRNAWTARLLEEAPTAYKSVAPVLDTVERSGMARAVARLRPLLTIKG